MRNIEQELKLSLTSREYEILTYNRHGEQQINNYFYAKGLKADIMVRIRQKSDAYILCVKQRMSDIGGIMLSEEKECEITAQYAQSFIQRGIDKEELQKLLGVSVQSNLYFVGSLYTTRCAFTLAEWNVEIDKNQYLGITDYELECESRNVEHLEKLKSYLSLTYGITAKPSVAKSQRFLDRLNLMAQQQ